MQRMVVVRWWLCTSGSGETGNFDVLSHIGPWRWRSITLQNHTDLNQRILQIWCKFGDPSLNGWWVMVGQAQNGVNLDFKVKFDLEGQGWSLHKTGTLIKLYLHFCSKFGDPSLNGSRVIVLISKWLTHRLTDTQTQATTVPKGQSWPRVKMQHMLLFILPFQLQPQNFWRIHHFTTHNGNCTLLTSVEKSSTLL